MIWESVTQGSTRDMHRYQFTCVHMYCPDPKSWSPSLCAHNPPPPNRLESKITGLFVFYGEKERVWTGARKYLPDRAEFLGNHHAAPLARGHWTRFHNRACSYASINNRSFHWLIPVWVYFRALTRRETAMHTRTHTCDCRCDAAPKCPSACMRVRMRTYRHVQHLDYTIWLVRSPRELSLQ